MGIRRERVETDHSLTPLPSGRWSRSQAQAVLAAWKKSGLSMSAYARRQGVNGQRLSWWRKQLGGAQEVGAAVTFIPAVVGARAAMVTVRLPRGIDIETTDVASLSPSWLAEVVGALERLG